MRNEETINLSVLPDEVLQDGISPYLPNQDLLNTALINHSIFSLLEPVRTARAMQALLQAVIDDKRDKVKEILKHRPYLLLQDPNAMEAYGVSLKVIESQYTWQKFFTEPPLVMVRKRKQPKMVETLLPHFERLENGTQASVEQWESAERALAERNERFEKEDKYSSLINNLIKVIAQETFPNGFRGERSQKTEDALKQFRQAVLPDEAIALDNYFDIEQLLITAYDEYVSGCETLTWDQKDVFCINVIGFIQSLLSPEDAKVFCQGLYGVVDDGEEISDRAARLRLVGGESFYRDDRQAEGGLGFKYFCGGIWGGRGGAAVGGWGAGRGHDACLINKLCEAKATDLRQLKPQLLQPSEPTEARVNCVLL